MPTLAETAPPKNPPRRILMTDEKRLADPFTALAALTAGDAVILRHYHAPGRAELAGNLLSACRGRGIRLLIGADARLARNIGADGLHLPEAMLRSALPLWRLWRRPGWLVTAAAHSPAALARAARGGVDAALLSPVFATASHSAAAPIGVTRFAAWAGAANIAVYALGGVTRNNYRRLARGGTLGWATTGGLLTEKR